MTPEQRYAAIVVALRDEPGVIHASGNDAARNRLGAAALKVHDKIFAMLTGGGFVVKLPRQRVDVLVAAGEGQRFDPRHDGRLMKEWLVVAPAAESDWLALAREAKSFVASKRH